MLLTASRFWDRIHSGEVLLSDGGMGSELIGKGIAPDSILGANTSAEADVRAIHAANIAAGAEFITSNTFGLAMGESRLDHVRAGLRIAVESARQANSEIGVWFSLPSDAWKIDPDEVRSWTDEAPNWSWMVLVETCTGLDQARLNVSAAMLLEPVLLAVTGHFGGAGKMLDGTEPETFVTAMRTAGAHILGANCGVGPDQFIHITRRMRAVTDAPLLVQPSAGIPEWAGDGRWRYPVDGEAFGPILSSVVRSGANIVGGCCGVTPAHIAAFASLRKIGRQIIL